MWGPCEFYKAHTAFLRSKSPWKRRPSGRCSNLVGAVLISRDLTAADFFQANLRDARLNQARLVGATFTSADITGVHFSDAHLAGADGIRYVSIMDGWGPMAGRDEFAMNTPWRTRDGRRLLAVDHGEEEGIIVHYRGFRGTFDELDQYIEEGQEEYRASRSRAARMLREMIEDAP